MCIYNGAGGKVPYWNAPLTRPDSKIIKTATLKVRRIFCTIYMVNFPPMLTSTLNG